MILLQVLGENVDSGSSKEERQWCHNNVARKIMAIAMMIVVTMRMTTKKTVATAVMTVLKIRMMMIASDDGAKENNADGLYWVFHVPSTVCSKFFT